METDFHSCPLTIISKYSIDNLYTAAKTLTENSRRSVASKNHPPVHVLQLSRACSKRPTPFAAPPAACRYVRLLFASSFSSSCWKIRSARKTGSRQEPDTGTHLSPRSATAIGGIIL